jgi:predicted secreted acid phosphatase
MRVAQRSGRIRSIGGLAAAIGLVAVIGVGSAIASDAPKTARHIPNLDTVKQEIIAYHDSGNWNREISKIDGGAERYLTVRLRHGVKKPAIVLDIDDTSLSSYPYEVANDFGYDPTIYNQYVFAEKFTAIPGTLALATYAHAHGVKVFLVTGRRQSAQMQTATLGNLAQQGYPAPDGLYLRPTSDTNSSVIPYKSGTRAGIQKLGYDIVVNVGDQWSDLQGGHADHAYKLPNPMYLIG